MRLNEHLCSSLTKEILQKLVSVAHINTVNDLCTLDESKIVYLSKMLQIDYQILKQIRKELFEKYVPLPKSGLDIYYKLIQKCVIYKTGNNSLDRMLQGGIYSGEITEVYGYSAAGKTQFCYSFICSVVTETIHNVLYIDTDLAFNASRIMNILKGRPHSNVTAYSLPKIMSRIKLCTVFDTFQLLNFIECITQDLDLRGQNSKYSNIGVIILDSLSCPLSLTVNKLFATADNEQDGNRKKSLKIKSERIKRQFAVSLKTLAVRHSIAVVVVNSHVFNLGKFWQNNCNVRINIEKMIDNPGKRTIQVTQSDRQFRGCEFINTFVIRPSGLRSTFNISHVSSKLQI